MAITRSMKKGHDPPASSDDQSFDVEDTRKTPSKSKAPRRRQVVQENEVDHLTALPLELFRMILEELVKDVSRTVYFWKQGRKYRAELTRRIDQLIGLRFVSKLFWTETMSAIFKAGRPRIKTTGFFWDHVAKVQPLMISRLLLEESLARPSSDIGILAVIQQVVERLLQLQPDGSTISRRAYFEETCSCIFHSLAASKISDKLDSKTTTEFKYPILESFEEDVVNSCLAVASWIGNIPLLDVLESKYGPIAGQPTERAQPRFMGSVQWAAACNGDLDVVKYLRRKGCHFGQRQSSYFENCSPLCGMLDGNHTQLLDEILPAYDKYRTGTDWTATELRSDLICKFAIDGSEDICRAFWARKPLLNEQDLSEALAEVCENGRYNKVKKAAALVQAGASVNKYCEEKYTTPLEAAIKAGTPELLQFLLQNGGNPKATVVERLGSPKKYRSDPLVEALNSGKIESMKVLLQHCKWEVATRVNLLLKAINRGGLDMIQVLVSPEHFDPTSSTRANNLGRAAVRQARANLKTEIVDVLLAHGCEG